MSQRECERILNTLKGILVHHRVEKFILVIGDQDSHDGFNIFEGPHDWLQEVALLTLVDIHKRGQVKPVEPKDT